MGIENAHSFLSYLLNELPCCSLEYTTFVIGTRYPFIVSVLPEKFGFIVTLA